MLDADTVLEAFHLPVPLKLASETVVRGTPSGRGALRQRPRPAPLLLDHVARVDRRLEAGLVHGEARAGRACQRQRAGEELQRAPPAAQAETEGRAVQQPGVLVVA